MKTKMPEKYKRNNIIMSMIFFPHLLFSFAPFVFSAYFFFAFCFLFWMDRYLNGHQKYFSVVARSDESIIILYMPIYIYGHRPL